LLNNKDLIDILLNDPLLGPTIVQLLKDPGLLKKIHFEHFDSPDKKGESNPETGTITLSDTIMNSNGNIGQTLIHELAHIAFRKIYGECEKSQYEEFLSFYYETYVYIYFIRKHRPVEELEKWITKPGDKYIPNLDYLEKMVREEYNRLPRYVEYPNFKD
jgi:hypothetical protein